jgi:CHAT domain-containing protein
MYARRRITTILIVCGLLQGLQHVATAQDYQRYERFLEALRLSQQAEALYNAGRHDEAIPLAERAVALEGYTYTQRDFRYSLLSPYSILGRLYRAKGDYARAEAAYLRLLKLMERPPGDLDTFPAARAYNELAAVYEAKGDYARALQSRARGNELIELNLVKTLAPAVRTQPGHDGQVDSWEALRNRAALEVARLSGGENYRQAILDSLAGETNAAVSLNTRYLPQDRQAAQLALTTLLQRKGRLLDARAGQLAVLRRYGNQQDQQLIDQLTRVYVRGALSSEAGRTSVMRKAEELQRAIAEGRPTDKIQAELENEIKLSMLGPGGMFTSQQEQIEVEGAVSRRSAELRKPEPPITLNAIAQAIPADAALVEFISYKPFNAKAKTESEEFGGPRYAAYVLRRDEVAPQLVELGDAAGVEEAVRQLLAALRDPRRTDVRDLARALDERVMRPVRKLLGPARRIFLAPDGALNLFPFSALVDEKNQFLIENYSVSYLTSGRDLLRLQNRGESREALKVFANPLFDLTAGKQQVSGGRRTDPPADQNVASGVLKDLTGRNYTPLPGTAAEADALSRLFPDAALFTEARATEASLKSVNRPRFLHIATHGFFLADRTESVASSQAQGLGGRQGRARNTAVDIGQLLDSGLILAGVRQGTSGAGEDGVLTALEVVGMDLWGTRLVVLSACETGLGDVKNGEGVYGLRRALVLAGSETQVMSLWKVSDAGTRDLMVAYYTLLQKGESRIEAMCQVQQAMLRGELLHGSGNKQFNLRDTGELGDVAPAKDYRHPYYWAAFITSGDWRNMDGKEAQSR